ncbi:MAG: RnfH family protein [Gammaproteobacteria bacterium]|jgi:putative ubiquitin-RnfH superfamily antitoxin RatB of RatAB toxin-antitoxin module|nr:RnfH family protein [Gammaproteobacteria bacterium]
MDKAMLDVEVAYALANKQKIVELRVAEGTTVRQAAMLSGLDREFPGLDLAGSPLGIFGRAVSKPDEQVLEHGDRVEIYRPLLVDPKEVRKQRAQRAAQTREG